MLVTPKIKNKTRIKFKMQINLNANLHSAQPVSADNDTNCAASNRSSKAISDSLLLSG